jgi:hypothetical protein
MLRSPRQERCDACGRGELLKVAYAPTSNYVLRQIMFCLDSGARPGVLPGDYVARLGWRNAETRPAARQAGIRRLPQTFREPNLTRDKSQDPPTASPQAIAPGSFELTWVVGCDLDHNSLVAFAPIRGACCAESFGNPHSPHCLEWRLLTHSLPSPLCFSRLTAWRAPRYCGRACLSCCLIDPGLGTALPFGTTTLATYSSSLGAASAGGVAAAGPPSPSGFTSTQHHSPTQSAL